MKRLTDAEIAVMDHFRIVPNNFNGEGRLPEADEVEEWLRSGPQELSGIDVSHLTGAAILGSLRRKLWDDFEDDAISLEDTATWVLSHYFTASQLMEMQPKEAEEFLRNWKYFLGFRKCDGWGMIYLQNAISALSGELKLDPYDDEYFYQENED